MKWKKHWWNDNYRGVNALFLLIKKAGLLFLFLFAGLPLFSQNNDSLISIKLLFAGDVMGHGPQIKSAWVDTLGEYDYTPCFRYVESIIRKADLAIANLEVTLPGKPPYSGYPRFKSPDDLAIALKLAGFDLLVTANNHANDAGKKGVIQTIKTLSDYGFYQTGTFTDSLDRIDNYPLIVYKGSFKLAFLNYTYGTNGIKTQPPVIVNLIDEKQIEKDIAKAKLFSPDAIIVIMHWGYEYHLKESKKQSALAKKMIGWGADLIIGSHPHVIQPIRTETAITKDSTLREELVVYSMGNFISNQTKPNTDGGLMVEVELTKNIFTREVKTADYAYYFLWRYIHKNKARHKTYYTLPATAFEDTAGQELIGMKSKDKTALKAFLKKMRAHYKDISTHEKHVTLREIE